MVLPVDWLCNETHTVLLMIDIVCMEGGNCFVHARASLTVSFKCPQRTVVYCHGLAVQWHRVINVL